jgi:hypothetical protein
VRIATREEDDTFMPAFLEVIRRGCSAQRAAISTPTLCVLS